MIKKFYEETGIEFHCIITNVKEYTSVDVSYKTHPEWKLIEAVYGSCALPILFEPLQVDGEFYADGCLLYNYPLYQCIQTCFHHSFLFLTTHWYIASCRRLSRRSDVCVAAIRTSRHLQLRK